MSNILYKSLQHSVLLQGLVRLFLRGVTTLMRVF